MGRVTALPIYQNNGLHLLHLGFSANYRKAEEADPGTSGPGIVDLSARPLMRDAIGDYASTVIGSTATVPVTLATTKIAGTTVATGAAATTATVITASTLPGNKAKMVDTGKLSANSTAVLAPELFYVCGPFCVQAEYGRL